MTTKSTTPIKRVLKIRMQFVNNAFLSLEELKAPLKAGAVVFLLCF